MAQVAMGGSVRSLYIVTAIADNNRDSTNSYGTTQSKTLDVGITESHIFNVTSNT